MSMLDTINSVEDLVNGGLAACMDKSSAIQQAAVRGLFPALLIRPTANADMPKALKDGKCSAIVIDEANYAIW